MIEAKHTIKQDVIPKTLSREGERKKGNRRTEQFKTRRTAKQQESNLQTKNKYLANVTKKIRNKSHKNQRLEGQYNKTSLNITRKHYVPRCPKNILRDIVL